LFAWPAGAIAGSSVVLADMWSSDNSGTAATLTALICFFVILISKSQPLRDWRLALVTTMCGLALGALAFAPIQDFFDFSVTVDITWKSAVLSIPLVAYVVASVRKNS
jgi:hypothetical protein